MAEETRGRVGGVGERLMLGNGELKEKNNCKESKEGGGPTL